MSLKIDKTDFVWFEVTRDVAKAIYNICDVFLLDKDDTDTLITSIEDINKHDYKFGLGVGYKHHLIKKFL